MSKSFTELTGLICENAMDTLSDIGQRGTWGSAGQIIPGAG